MSIELSGQDFQCWKDFRMTLDGLTVIVGPSNNGKSALKRSIKGALRNTISQANVRKGAERARIEITLDGHTIVAERPAKGSVTYQVDGADYQKLDGKVPEPIVELGTGILTIGKEKMDPVFADQFGEQFMLQMGETQLNTVLGAFSSTEKLEFGKRAANVKIGEKNAEAKLLAKELQGAESRRLKLAALAATALEVQARIDGIEAEVTRLEQTVSLLDDLIEHKGRLDVLQGLTDQLKVPETEAVSRSIQVVRGLDQLIAARTRHERLSGILSRLPVPDIEPALVSFDRMRFAGQAAVAKQRGSRAQDGLDSIAVCVETWTEIVATYKRTRALDEAVTAMSSQKDSKTRKHLAKVERHVETLNELLEGARDLQTGVRQAEILLASQAKQEASQASLRAVETELVAEEARVAEVVEAYRLHQQEKAIEAAKAKIKTCAKCGEAMKA